MDTENKGEILLSALLDEINMKDSAAYTLTGIDGNSTDLTSEDIKSAKVVSSDEGYTVSFADKEIILKSVKVKWKRSF